MTLTRAGAGLPAATLAAMLFAGIAVLSGCHAVEPATPPLVEAPPGALPVAPREQPLAVSLPECDGVNAAAEAEQAAFLAEFGADNITAPYGETDRALFTEFAGPGALAAEESVVQERNCTWVIYLDSVYLSQFTAELPQPAMRALREALRAEGFTEAERGPATVFTAALPTGDMRGIMGVSHAFVGDIWITLVENSSGDYTQSAIDTILAAHPGLAETLAASCVDRSPDTEIEQGAARLDPPPAGTDDAGDWDTARAIELAADTFDACAPLSWALLPAVRDRGPAATHIMLFNFGDFVGTASLSGFEFTPSVTRLSPSSVSATFRWRAEGDSGAAASGRAVSEFTWDAALRELAHAGDFPPR